MRDDEATATILRGKLDSNGALAFTEEPLHSWVPEFNHELDRRTATANKSTWFQQQFIPT